MEAIIVLLEIVALLILIILTSGIASFTDHKRKVNKEIMSDEEYKKYISKSRLKETIAKQLFKNLFK